MKEEILNYIKFHPGLKFKHLLIRLELNEATLDRNLKILIKFKSIRKSEDKRYWEMKKNDK